MKDEQGYPLSNLLVECYTVNSASPDNYIGNTVTDSLGHFEISFNYPGVNKSERSFEVNLDSNDISEAQKNPNAYVLVRDNYRILYKSHARTNSLEMQKFDVVIRERLTFSDPYANSFQREVSLILANVTREVVDLSQVDPLRAAQQMIRILGNLLYYNVQGVRLHGYPGPQVPRYPKRQPHSHSLPWNAR